jgi:hypothetical protein
MAEFVTASLTHSLTDNRVLFRVDAKIKFSPHERDSMWFLRIKFIEDDIYFDDNLGTHTHNFRSHTENDLSIGVSMRKSDVNTERFKEEVFAKIEVLPLEEPQQFRHDTVNTNVTKVSV